MMIVRGIQIKVARVAAGLTHQELANESNVAISTLRRIEVEPQILTARVETLGKIIDTLEKHGIIISSDDDQLMWVKCTA